MKKTFFVGLSLAFYLASCKQTQTDSTEEFLSQEGTNMRIAVEVKLDVKNKDSDTAKGCAYEYAYVEKNALNSNNFAANVEPLNKRPFEANFEKNVNIAKGLTGVAIIVGGVKFALSNWVYFHWGDLGEGATFLIGAIAGGYALFDAGKGVLERRDTVDAYDKAYNGGEKGKLSKTKYEAAKELFRKSGNSLGKETCPIKTLSQLLELG